MVRLAIELYTGRFERLPSFCHLRRWFVRKFKSDQLACERVAGTLCQCEAAQTNKCSANERINGQTTNERRATSYLGESTPIGWLIRCNS